MTRWHQPGPGSAFRERSAYGQTNITVGISFVWSVVQFHVGWHQDFNLKPRYDFGRQGRQNLFSWVCSCTYKRIWTSQTFDFERLYLHLICWLAIGDMIWKTNLPETMIYVWVHNRSNMPMFCLKKLISQPWVVQKSQFLEEMTLTQYILMSLIKRSNNKLIKLIK